MAITISLAPSVAPGSVLDLSWPSSNGAATYRVEMATQLTPPAWSQVAAGLTAPAFAWTVPAPTGTSQRTRLRVTSLGPTGAVVDTGETSDFTITDGGLHVATSGAYVIYTGGAIDPANPPSQELALANLPAGLTDHTRPMPGVPAGATILATWWAPFDNIAALSGFATILVSPAGGNQIRIQGHGYAGSATRIRLMINALWR